MALSGGCRCGAVRYEAGGKPVYQALCHCADCRRSSGAPMMGWALFSRDDVAISGSPVDYESSPGAHRQFCGTCGTGLFYLNEAIFPGQVDIQFATLDDPNALPPALHVQRAEAAEWIGGIEALPKFERYPG